MKAVVLDCDGVLINTEHLGAQLLKTVFNRVGIEYTPQKRAERYTGVSAAETRRRLQEEFDQAASQKWLPGRLLFRARTALIMHALRKEYMTYIDKHMAPLEGVFDCLNALKEKDVLIAMASNSDRATLAKKLHRFSLADYFTPHIYSGDMVARHKPAPDIYIHAAARLGVDPAECVVVDDSITGITAAKAAGAYAIGFTGDERELDDAGDRLLAAGADEAVDSMAGLQDRLTLLVRPPENRLLSPQP